MEGSIDRQRLVRLTVQIVGDIANRAKNTIRPHSVAAGEGVGDSFLLDGKPCQLSANAPPELEFVAMTLQAFDNWEAATNSGDMVTAMVAALALGCSVQESQLVASIQRTTGQLIAAAAKTREGNSRGGRKGKWTAKCAQFAGKEYKRLRHNPKLSDSQIYKQIATTIQKELKVNIGWQAVRRHLLEQVDIGKARP